MQQLHGALIHQIGQQVPIEFGVEGSLRGGEDSPQTAGIRYRAGIVTDAVDALVITFELPDNSADGGCSAGFGQNIPPVRPRCDST